jgi:hypothetical protein
MMLDTLPQNTRKIKNAQLGLGLNICLSLLWAGVPGKVACVNSLTQRLGIDKGFIRNRFSASNTTHTRQHGDQIRQELDMKLFTSKKNLFCCLLAFLILVSGCSLKKPPVSLTEQPILAPYQPFRIVQICLDTPPLYPEYLFRAAANAIANRIDTSITVNFGGMEVYVTLITHDSYQEDVLQFSIPAFPADPSKPQLVQSPNVYNNADANSTYQNQLASWQQALVSQHHKLVELRKQVKQYTDKLRSLPDPYDDKGADLWGCLQDATLHFQQAGEKYLLIASALVNNTDLQKSAHINLSGASARVIWRICHVAATCQASNAYWTQVFLKDGAKAVSFYDPASSDNEKPTF